MFVAHMPAGYLLTRAIQRRLGRTPGLLPVGLVASVLPDFDLLYHYLWDDRRTAHHYYFTHFPSFWIALSAVVALVLIASGRRLWLIYVWVVLANVLMHLVLDTVAADILWLYPYNLTPFHLTYVPALYHPWFLNFLFHWTALAEVAIVVAAAVVLARELSDRRRPQPAPLSLDA